LTLKEGLSVIVVVDVLLLLLLLLLLDMMGLPIELAGATI
jgi:hypothetical protein